MTPLESERLIKQSRPYDPELIAIAERTFDGEAKDVSGTAWDLKRNTDCLLFKNDWQTIRLCLRSMGAKALQQYPSHIMFRHKENVPYRTEWDKMMAGHGDYVIYGFNDGRKIIAYKVIDLDAVREFVRCEKGVHDGIWFMNHSADKSGMIVDTKYIPQSVIAASPEFPLPIGSE